MLELVSVEMKNFRSFTDATFFPAQSGEGLTAIVGENGSGKSSIVSAVLFCLYGITPDGVTVSALRKQGTTEPVVVKTNLNHNNQNITIERSIRGTTDKTTAKIILNGFEQTSISSRAATQWVVQETGLNAESFTSAFVVRQKELDSLIKARPAERRKTIERLAGVETMSQAISLAKEDLKSKKITLESLTSELPQEDTGKITNNIDELHKSNEKITAEEEEKGELLKSLTEQRNETEEKIKLIRSLNNDNKELAHKSDVKQEQLRSIVEKIHTNIKKVEEFTSEGGHIPNLETLEIELENISEKINTFEKEKAKNEEREKTIQATQKKQRALQDEEKNQQGELSNLSNEIKKVEEDILGLKKGETENGLNDIRKETQITKENIAVINNTLKITADTLKIFEEHTHNIHESQVVCPTCSHTIHDTEKVKNQLVETQRTHKASLAKERNKDAENAKKLEILERTLKTITEKENYLASLRRDEKYLHKQHQNVTEGLKTTEEKLKTLQAEHQSESEKFKDQKKTTDNLNLLYKKCNEKIIKAEKAHEAEKELVFLRNQKDDKISEIEKIHTLKEKNEEKINTMPHMGELEKNKESLNELIDNVKNEILTLRHEKLTNEKTIEHLNDTLSKAQSMQKRIESLKTETETLSGTLNALVEFRKDRLARLSPELSDITSDLLSEMTNNKYTTVELDEDFTPYVTNDNSETRQVSWLSGGEESLVALAMRIAVGEILAGGRNGNVLILDEVLTAQDRNRREATLASLRNLNRQTIVINHIEEATDIADKVVYITQPESGHDEEGSQIHN